MHLPRLASRALPLVAVLAVGLGLVTPAAAQGPTLSVIYPTNGASVGGTRVTISYQVTDFAIVPTNIPLSEAGKHPEVNRPGEGHVHFQLDLGPLTVWDKPGPFTIDSLPPGEHQLMVELANNDHSSLSPRVMEMITFRSGPGDLPKTGSEPMTPLQGAQGVAVVGALLLIVGGVILRRGGVLAVNLPTLEGGRSRGEGPTRKRRLRQSD